MSLATSYACLVFSTWLLCSISAEKNDNFLERSLAAAGNSKPKCRGKEAELRFIMLLNRVWLPIWSVLSSNVRIAANANNFFTFKLYQMLASESENLFFSPFSISFAFALVHASANGKSKLEIADVFGFKEINRYCDVSLRLYFQVVNAKSTEKAYFHTANKIWIDETLNLSKPFCSKLKLFYGRSISTLNFKENAEESRVQINKWIRNKTQQKIINALTPGSINGLTDFVVTNAIYFKGSWQTEFDPQLTYKGKFYVTPKDVVMVDMMRKTDVYLSTYDSHLQSTIIELPYSCEKFSMLIIAPSDKTTLKTVESVLAVKRMDELVSSLSKKQIRLILPKFRLPTSYDLVPSLKALGIKNVFSSDADFSELTGGKGRLAIQEVIHKAFIEVNEKGTVSAAVTTIFRGRSLLPILLLDHPFLFLIRDRETNTILFVGKIVNPVANP